MKKAILITAYLLFLFASIRAQTPRLTVIYQDTDVITNLFSVEVNGQDQLLFDKQPVAGSGMIEKLSIAYPTHIISANTFMKPGGVSETQYINLILLPGDSVSVAGNHVNSREGFRYSADELLDLKEADYATSEVKILETLKHTSLEKLLKDIHDAYTVRQEKLNANSWELSKPIIEGLKTFNLLLKYKRISAIPFDKVIKTAKDSLLLNEAYQEIDIDKIQHFNSAYRNQIYYGLIRYYAFHKGAFSADFWECAFRTDPEIQDKAFFTPYLMKQFKQRYSNQHELLDNLMARLEKIKEKRESLLTFQRLLTAFKKATVNFSEGKALMDRIENGRYQYILGAVEYENTYRNIATLNLLLENKDGKKEDFQKVMFGSGKGLIFIDFWASWCAPCIMEHPLLLKAKLKFKNRPIHFVHLSIDRDEDTDKWLSMAKKINNNQLENQYRLPDAYRSVIHGFFDLKTIPRFILLNQQGLVLDFEFVRPSDIDFENNLNNYLLDLNRQH